MHIECFLASLRMCADQRVHGQRSEFDPGFLANIAEIFDLVDRLKVQQRGLLFSRKRGVAEIHVREAGVAAGRRQIDGIEGGVLRRVFVIGVIRMPCARAEGDHAALLVGGHFTAVQHGDLGMSIH